ncbi:unnamed protein product [Heligmosomoides polygyrus]|uniref:Uncharacterized protein n=1 Tax=Heligmosomoides polygyrus TaxID=6339 RepID=A0A3P8BSA0_HELPZ|nr:unnamed protein product [Heligmosomoides polygyrus]
MFRYVSLMMLVTTIPAMIVERSFASRFIADYEKLPRPWVYYLVNCGSIALSTFFYCTVLLASQSTWYLAILTLIFVVFIMLSSLTIVLIFRRDAAKLRDITNETGFSTINYTLSLKFQLAENVRVTKLLVHVSVRYSVWGFFGCCLSACSLIVFGESQPLGQLLYALLDNYIAM